LDLEKEIENKMKKKEIEKYINLLLGHICPLCAAHYCPAVLSIALWIIVR
jgi:hypothetical protein